MDTLVLIGDDILRNPSTEQIDSTLKVYKKTDVDSVAVIAVSQDSAYSFPLTNYPSSVAETRIAGDNNQVSEVTRQSDEKTVYKLKIDDNTLRRRNVTDQPTTYMKRIVMADKIAKQLNTKIARQQIPVQPTIDTAKKQNDIFQNEFSNEKPDTGSLIGKVFNAEAPGKKGVLENAKLYTYKPPKFYVDYGSVSISNDVLFNTYQTYQGGQGPINLNSDNSINGIFRMGTTELLEDQKIFGGFNLSTNLKDNQWMVGYENYKRRFDWGGTFYRAVTESSDTLGLTKVITNIGEANVAYPLIMQEELV
ncbi:MAG: hypothetical protein WDM71_03000 [Ferruginibacter sp.]